ncbi:replication endonuclease, partial [Pseudoalteromonas sp. SIMBA_153]
PRFDVVAIDPEKGSAVAYIAKYISKNINGGRMTGADDNDHEAETDAATGANAVTSWSRWHCIRQFQFFGAASVTLWRELRRVREP